uniref:Putative secreted protein n=1 Tax=Amblyomma triste TaxID=251400 RepID=A0A023G1F3_AMBTT
MVCRPLASCLLSVLVAFSLQLFTTTTALPNTEVLSASDSEAPKSDQPKQFQESEPCDGNEDCPAGFCCVRPNINNGTICLPLNTKGQECSITTLEEHSVPAVPSCRSDDGSKSVKEHKPPYDRKCPCTDDLECSFLGVEARAAAEKEQSEKEEAPLGNCQAKTPNTPEQIPAETARQERK